MDKNNELIIAARTHLQDSTASHPAWALMLTRHLAQVDRWTDTLIATKPETNLAVVKFGVWLHDIGQLVGPNDVDHAINSEAEVRRFLPTLGVDPLVVEQVAHCARSHRCKDVQPETLEARILAACDSASHMTDVVYIDMTNRGEKASALAKLDRDLRDVGQFPELRELMLPLYGAWKGLLAAYPDYDGSEQSFKLNYR